MEYVRSYVFFGAIRSLNKDCLRCGQYELDNKKFVSCSYTSCPIALKEFKRRQMKRETVLENEILPNVLPGEIVNRKED